MTATKRITRIGAIFLLVVTLLSSFATSALAASKVSYRTTSGTTNGGSSAYVYVKTGSTAASRKVKLTMEKGTIAYDYMIYSKEKSVYGSYEIKASYWNGSKWVVEQDYDVYNKSSNTITLAKKNTYYRIQIYSWKATTVFKSYYDNDIITYNTRVKASDFTDIHWSKNTTCTAKPNNSKMTMYNGNPV